MINFSTIFSFIYSYFKEHTILTDLMALTGKNVHQVKLGPHAKFQGCSAIGTAGLIVSKCPKITAPPLSCKDRYMHEKQLANFLIVSG